MPLSFLLGMQSCFFQFMSTNASHKRSVNEILNVMHSMHAIREATLALGVAWSWVSSREIFVILSALVSLSAVTKSAQYV